MIWSGVLVAVFAWWFATGAILLAVRQADRRGGHAMLVLAALPLLAVGLGLVRASLPVPDVPGVFMGFAGALLVWGWIELAFLAGVITGPVQGPALPGQVGLERFSRAFGTLAWHELALVLALLGLVIASEDAPNRIALATFLVLFLARICAKLNLFFGVPRINVEFVPARLDYLTTYFRRGPISMAFPIAVTVLTVLLAVCAERLWQADVPAAVAGYALLSTLAALALLEHWLMVVPLPDAKLWRWMLPAPATDERKSHGL